jgi:hypothetical protein
MRTFRRMGIAASLVLLAAAAALGQGTWSTATLSEARYGLAATSVGNLALFAGGWSDASQSNVAVVDLFTAPEPATLTLLAMGGLAIVGRRRAAKRSWMIPPGRRRRTDAGS